MREKVDFERQTDDFRESPVQRIKHPALLESEIELWMKRDDLIHPFISGNKWRKLKYIVQEMSHNHTNHLITFGGPWSNHVLASAAAGATFGFKTTAFIRGESVKNPVLTMAQLFGMELIFTDRTSYRAPQALFEGYKAKAVDPSTLYYLEQGGHHPQALKGCAEILQDLQVKPDLVYCACGTGTTLAGLALGIQNIHTKNSAHKTKLIGVPVIGQGENLRKPILELNPNADFELLSSYTFGGYARTKPELLEFIRDFCTQTGILIEPVYTGKLFYAIFDQIRQGKIPPRSKILAIHTGGITGILGMYDQWN